MKFSQGALQRKLCVVPDEQNRAVPSITVSMRARVCVCVCGCEWMVHFDCCKSNQLTHLPDLSHLDIHRSTRNHDRNISALQDTNN